MDEIARLKEKIVELNEEIKWLKGSPLDYDEARPKHFTPTEWRLIKLFVRRQKLSKHQLLSALWGIDNEPQEADNIVCIYIMRLRNKLNGINIINEWGKGYRINDEDWDKLKRMYPDKIGENK